MHNSRRIEFEDISRSIKHKLYQVLFNYASKKVDEVIMFSYAFALICVSILSLSGYSFKYLFSFSAICLLLSILLIFIDKRKEIELEIAWFFIYLLPMVFSYNCLINGSFDLLLNQAHLGASMEELRSTIKILFFYVYLIPTLFLFTYKILHDNYQKLFDKLTEF